ncbi:MAG: acyl-[acyl-carrier-protein]--UDP-N-acetylglucosamine O-acyltransferase [Salinivirgaceae bacterium]|nr:MAG: acyl-[acyl-carrier-protein]--UDP-N-acetylglucosamine O-acyltransferase [Salinivirgaceae bacterium]
MSNNMTNIHPNAKIGKDVVVSPFTTIEEDVVIGDGTWIGPNVTIMNGARIGKNNKIFPGAVISAIPQDLKFQGEETTVEIGDNNTIRECVTINRGTAAKSKTVLGNNNLIMAYSNVAHDCILSNNIIIANATQLAGEVEIDDFAIVGGMSAIHQFCRVGKHVMISGGSLIGKDIPPYVMAARHPIAYAGVNSVGLRRRKFSNEQIQQVQDIYRIIFQQGLNNSDALALIEKEIPASAEREEIVAFVKSSSRGLMKGYTPE